MKLTAIGALSVISLAGAAPAAVIAYDGFAYPSGPLFGNGPGTGFSTPWVTDGGVQVTAAGLSSAFSSLPSTGGAVAGSFNYEATLSSPIAAREFWASFLVAHVGQGNDQTFMGLTSSGIPFGAPPLIAFGVRLGQYGIFDAASVFHACGTPFTPPGSTDFLLAHFQPSGASYVVSLYVNPVPPLGAACVSLVIPLVNYDAVENQNQTMFSSDEVRLGDTAADVGFGFVSGPGACCQGTTCALTTATQCNGAYLGNGSACSAVGRFGTVNLCCPADFNNSGAVSVQDVFDFLRAWFAKCP